jgi:hypothetical protein
LPDSCVPATQNRRGSPDVFCTTNCVTKIVCIGLTEFTPSNTTNRVAGAANANDNHAQPKTSRLFVEGSTALSLVGRRHNVRV